MRDRGILLVIMMLLSAMINAQSIEGKWKTIDDKTGEVRSIVDIKLNNGRAYGKVVRVFNEDPDYDPICIACKGDLKDKRIIGMQIINGLSFKKDKWVGRKGVIDPDNGRFYYCKLKLDPENPNKLIVRGYITFLYREQTWLREK